MDTMTHEDKRMVREIGLRQTINDGEPISVDAIPGRPKDKRTILARLDERGAVIQCGNKVKLAPEGWLAYQAVLTAEAEARKPENVRARIEAAIRDQAADAARNVEKLGKAFHEELARPMMAGKAWANALEGSERLVEAEAYAATVALSVRFLCDGQTTRFPDGDREPPADFTGRLAALGKAAADSLLRIVLDRPWERTGFSALGRAVELAAVSGRTKALQDMRTWAGIWGDHYAERTAETAG